MNTLLIVLTAICCILFIISAVLHYKLKRYVAGTIWVIGAVIQLISFILRLLPVL